MALLLFNPHQRSLSVSLAVNSTYESPDRTPCVDVACASSAWSDPPVFCSEFAAAVQLTICVQLTLEAVAEIFTAAMNISVRESSVCEGKIEKRPSREMSLAGKFRGRVEPARSKASPG